MDLFGKLEFKAFLQDLVEKQDATTSRYYYSDDFSNYYFRIIMQKNAKLNPELLDKFNMDIIGTEYYKKNRPHIVYKKISDRYWRYSISTNTKNINILLTINNDFR